MQQELVAALQGLDRVQVFASSRGDEQSFEAEAWSNGAFTKALLDALQGHADHDGDLAVSLSELVDFVQRRVAMLTENRQHPASAKPIVADLDFIVARRSAADETPEEPIEDVVVPGTMGPPPEQATMSSDQTIMIGANRLGRARRGTNFVVLKIKADWIYGRFELPKGSVEGWVPRTAVDLED